MIRIEHYIIIIIIIILVPILHFEFLITYPLYLRIEILLYLTRLLHLTSIYQNLNITKD